MIVPTQRPFPEHGRQQASPPSTLDVVAPSDYEVREPSSEPSTERQVVVRASPPYDSSDDSDNSNDSLWSIHLYDLGSGGSIDYYRAESIDINLTEEPEGDDEPAPRHCQHWDIYQCGSRPYLSNRLAWALVRNTVGDGYIIQRWVEQLHAGLALRFRNSVPQNVWMNLTRLKLQLDDRREGDEHGHALFTGRNLRKSYPNHTTEREIMAVCRYLGDRLVGLSVVMCLPELVVPHVPRLVHGIIRNCPKLRTLGIEDLQCEYFRPNVVRF
ncbi:hypothetical protein OH77DRAFT_1428241 [Trametes cingulata]|nr:hypothetical protein OH77DRAFT_1428241 [Trametes cingulata]